MSVIVNGSEIKIKVDSLVKVAIKDKGIQGIKGESIQLQNNGTFIQWRVIGDASWINLIAIADLQGQDGDDGREVELQNNGTFIQWRYVGESWTNLVDLEDIKGEDGAPATNLVTSVAGRQGVVVLTKADVALSNVDNTSDANKPISNDTQTALNLKVDKVSGERLINAAEITKLGNQSGTNTGDQNDHSLLNNLGNDDHTHYMRLSGRLGGQTLIGGSGVSDMLTLQGTSGNGTLTDKAFRVLVANNGNNEAITALNNGNIGIGVVNPTARLHIQGPTLTGSTATSGISFTQVWNTTGSPTGIFANINIIASGASAKVMDLQVNGVSVVDVRLNRMHIGIGTTFVGDLTTPALLLGSTLNNGFYVDSNRIFIKSGGAFTGAFTSTGFVGGSGLFSNTSANDLITPIFIPHRLTASGLKGGVQGNSNGDISIITNNISRIFAGFTGEIGIGTTTPNARAKMDIQSTTQGFMPPRMTTTQRNAIATVAGDGGLTIFNTTTTKLETWDGTVWQQAW